MSTARPIPTPDGCQHCGHEKRDHYRRYTSDAGWHGWTEPTAKQRSQRMFARRAARIAAKAPAAP